MKHRRTLQITSLLSILFFSLHWADDVVRGFAPGGGVWSVYPGLLMLTVWLYGTVVLLERRSGVALILLFSFLASVIPVLHIQGPGMVGGRIEGSSGMLFWVWTLLGLGVTAILSFVLSAHGLWSLRQSAAAGEVRS